MSLRLKPGPRCLIVISMLLLCQLLLPLAVSGAGATSSVRIVKYGQAGGRVLAERTVSYMWMKDNLAVHGDGKTHYYHQGPVFEGDSWDPGETQNLKDKGAVMGTAVDELLTGSGA